MTSPSSTPVLPRAGSIEHWAQTRPDAVAYHEGDRQITWRQLNVQADRLAHGLQRRGVRKGWIVAVRMQVRIEWVIVAAALAKLGCAMVGMNWRLTASETEYLLTNSGAQAMVCDDADLTEAATAARAAKLAVLVSIDADGRDLGFAAYADLLAVEGEPLVSASEPSLLIYTSGTTGRPKGVAVGGHPDADPTEVREYRESMEVAGAVEGEVVQLISMPMHHASGPSQVWAAMRKGRTAVLMRRFDPEQALALIERHRVGLWAAVPTMYKRVAGLPAETVARYDVSSIKRLSVGAAPVPYALKQWILDTFGRDVLQENYGSTETSMVSSLAPDMQEKKPGSSGKPFKHVHIDVRDADGNNLPQGQVGELWIKTPVTLRNYLNAGPLGEATLDAKGHFRTGDVGYLDDDGYLFITDRVKDMIISGGVNIYPAEIESALMLHPAVQDVAVIGIPHEDFGEQVLALAQLKTGRHVTEDELKAHAAEHLASYKRPKRIEFMADLPKNGMGKVLKRELRDPYWKDKERKV